MTCQHCGATIAGKAIVCYRCGTPTAIPEAARKAPASTAAARSGRASLVAIVALLIGIAMEVAAVTAGALAPARGYVEGAGGLMIALAFLLAWRRRGRRSR